MSEIIEDVTNEQIDEDLKAGDKPHGSRFVVVKVDGVDHKVRPGRYIVKNFKRLVGVDPAFQLDQVVRGEFEELPDDSKLVIKGGEIFVSHVRGGGAS